MPSIVVTSVVSAITEQMLSVAAVGVAGLLLALIPAAFLFLRKALSIGDAVNPSDGLMRHEVVDAEYAAEIHRELEGELLDAGESSDSFGGEFSELELLEVERLGDEWAADQGPVEDWADTVDPHRW